MYSGRRYYFITIAETLNITRAAERLLVSQPSLTQYLNRLEKELDIKLVDRQFTPLRLTEAGRVYYDYLRQERRTEETLNASLARMRAQGRKKLLIGIPLQKSHELASRVIPDFAQEHPEIEISIWEGTSQTVRERVMRGELDIGFGHTMGEEFKDCVIKPLNREKVLLICSRDNPIAAGRASAPDRTLRVSAEQLNGLLFYQMAEEYYLYEVESRHMREHGVVPRRVTVMSNLHSIIASVMDGDGFAYMPDYVMDELWPRSVMERLAFLRLDERDLEWSFSMLRSSLSPMTAPMRLFWSRVVETCCAE